MAAIPRIYGVSDLRTRQNEILRQLSEGPIVLTQHARAVAVLVSPERWNEFMEEMESLQDIVYAREARMDAQPSMDLDEYVAKRDDRVSGKVE